MSDDLRELLTEFVDEAVNGDHFCGGVPTEWTDRFLAALSDAPTCEVGVTNPAMLAALRGDWEPPTPTEQECDYDAVGRCMVKHDCGVTVPAPQAVPDRCPWCDATDPAKPKYRTGGGIGLCQNPWHTPDRCPSCGSEDPASRRVLGASIGMLQEVDVCKDPWHKGADR